MSTKLCLWFGLIAGAFVGLFMGLLHAMVSPPPLATTWAKLALDGLVIALIADALAAAFACFVNRLAITPVFTLALLIALVTGLPLGPLTYHLPHPLLAMVVGALLGAALGRLICLIICRNPKTFAVGAVR